MARPLPARGIADQPTSEPVTPIQEPIAHQKRTHPRRSMTRTEHTAHQARSKEDGTNGEYVGDKPPTAPFKNNNTKLQRENNAAIIEIHNEHEGDQSPAIIKTTNSQPNTNGVDNDWNRIQHRLETSRERWKAQRKRPHNNIIPKECNTIQANVECTQSKTINKTSLRYIEVHLNNLKGKLIHGRQIFIHIFGTNRIEPKRNVIKWRASNLSIC